MAVSRPSLRCQPNEYDCVYGICRFESKALRLFASELEKIPLPKPDMTVDIEGGRIKAIGRTGRVRLPRGAQVIDAAGKFLIPGLWDMHVHFTEAERTFPLFIANGVTGVRNMGGDLDNLLRWRAEVASGKRLGPRIVTCGPIVDGPHPAAQGPVISVGNAAEGRQVVDTLKQRGADCVKVYDLLPREAYFAIIDEAKKQGVPIVGVYETMPTPGYNYQSWMLAEVAALEKAVANKTSTESLLKWK